MIFTKFFYSLPYIFGCFAAKIQLATKALRHKENGKPFNASFSATFVHKPCVLTEDFEPENGKPFNANCINYFEEITFVP
jgi:hypothetical protein